MFESREGIFASSRRWRAALPVPVNITAVNGANTYFLRLSTTLGGFPDDGIWRIHNLRLKCVDPGANTVTVTLVEFINNIVTIVDTFDITTANFTNYFTLMDMFNISELTGGHLEIYVRADAGGPYAVTGQYCYSYVT